MPNYKVAEGHRLCVDNVIYESGDNVVLDGDAAKALGSSLEKQSSGGQDDEGSRTESGEAANTGEQRQQARRQPRN